MPRKTWILRIDYNDGNVHRFEYTSFTDAVTAFHYAPKNSQLIERNFDDNTDTILRRKRADATIASLINAYEDDGRICRTSINWAHRVDKAWAHDFMFDKCLYTGIHPAHLDQIAVTASKGGEYV